MSSVITLLRSYAFETTIIIRGIILPAYGLHWCFGNVLSCHAGDLMMPHVTIANTCYSESSFSISLFPTLSWSAYGIWGRVRTCTEWHKGSLAIQNEFRCFFGRQKIVCWVMAFFFFLSLFSLEGSAMCTYISFVDPWESTLFYLIMCLG